MMQGAIVVSDFIENRFASELDRIAPTRQRLILGPKGFDQPLDNVEIAFFSGDLYPDRGRSFFLPLLKAPQLRWMHTYSAGVDHPIFASFREAGVDLTTSSGAASSPIAQTVMMYLLMLSRGMHHWSRAQAEKRWAPHPILELEHLRLLVVGLGPIGLETARLAQAMQMDVRGLRRSPRGTEGFPVRTLDALNEELEIADAVVLALPLNPETTDLLDRQRIGKMKKGSILVNIARGEMVDEEAVLEALKSGHLAGAALDVTREEPLPPESPLWTAPNLILTPHASGNSSRSHDRATEAFLENLERFQTGQPLRNLMAANKRVRT